MYVAEKTLRNSIFAVLSAVILSLPAGCFGMWGGAVDTPANLAASHDKESSIELAWSPVDGTGRYNIYRAGSEDGTYEQIAVSGYIGWIDTDVEQDRPYWYKVSATDFYGENESTLTAAVEGITYEYLWGVPAVVAASTATGSKLASDGSALWAIYAAEGNIILLRNENDPDDDDDIWMEQNRISAVWNGSSSGDLALAGGDDPVVLFYGVNNELEVRRWNDADEEWDDLGVPSAGDYESSTAQLLVSDDTVYVSWMSGGSPVVKRQVEPGKWQDVANLDFSDLGSPAPDVRAFHLVEYNDDLAMGILTALDPGSERLNIYLRSQLGWEPVSYLPDHFGPGTFSPYGFHISTTGTFGGGSMDISFYDSAAGSLRIWQYDGEVWTDLTNSDRSGANQILKEYDVGNGLPVVLRTASRLIIAGARAGALMFQQRRSATEEDRTEVWWTDLGPAWSFLPADISFCWAGDALYVQYPADGILTERRYR